MPRPSTPTTRPLLLAVVPPHIGGRRVGAALAGGIDAQVRIVVVERTDEDPSALAEAEVIVTGLSPVTAEDLEAAPRLRLVQCASHGHDYVDVATAAQRGVRVATIGGTEAEHHNVAEQTFALLLSLTKQIIPGHLALREGEWALPRLQRSITELHGKTLGIVGLGHIGIDVARLAAAFGMDVVYHEPEGASDRGGAAGARWLPLDELLRRADYVTLHLPLSPQTRGLIDARRLTLMKRTAFLINTSRGALVDQRSLAEALERGIIAGAGIDVFDPEPPSRTMRLLQAPNVVLSPHVAGVTRETLVRIAQAAVANAVRFLVTGELDDQVR